jgi:riboflavin kinase/FMN adenylyltransferase
VGLDNGSAVTIGAYDGVHIGHRQVIELVRRRAGDAGLRSVVVTFDKNPAAVVNPASAPPRLTDIDLKMELLGNTGVDQILVLGFDAERAKEKAEDFVTEVLVRQLGARVVVVGDDFHFGNERRGNVELLRSMGEQAGFSVEPVHLVSDEWEHKVVSSTRIRGLIAKGELAEAHALLGRSHEVRGVVAAPAGTAHLQVTTRAPGSPTTARSLSRCASSSLSASARATSDSKLSRRASRRSRPCSRPHRAKWSGPVSPKWQLRQAAVDTSWDGDRHS